MTTASPKNDTAESANAVSAEQARAILQFLQRTQLQGAEMPAYVDVFNTLSAIAGAATESDA